MSTAERTETRLPEALAREEGGAFVTWPHTTPSSRTRIGPQSENMRREVLVNIGASQAYRRRVDAGKAVPGTTRPAQSRHG